MKRATGKSNFGIKYYPWKFAAGLMICGLALVGLHGMTAAQTGKAGAEPAAKPSTMDLTHQPTLFVIGYAHLDTEWRWEYPQVIQEYLSKTMRNNFALFEKYPHYIFNFTGSNRYEMMKEYFPTDFVRLKHYVAIGRWVPAGSSVEENDVNSPSAESIIRQVLFGNEYFRHEFGRASEEYMLPDCFGFPASLPSILAHAGVRGFSTQKLSAAWQPAPHVGGPDSPEKTPEGIPYNVGIWEGPDGKTVIAALNPSSYDSDVYTDLSKNNTPPAGHQDEDYVWDWPDRVNIDGTVTGIFADYHYVGTGDIGGSAREDSVKLMEAIANKSETSLPPLPAYGPFGEETRGKPGPLVQVGTGPLRVVWSDADTMFREIKPSQTSRMPRWKGDLELINHSAGSLTSQAYHKRWNRVNEVLADAAEKASVGAAWLGGRAYPQTRLNRAWRLVLGGQFHDIMAGTATPQSYVYSWNDDVLAMNQFAGVVTDATEAIASLMDTQATGTPVVVFNQLNIPRQDVVEAQLSFLNGVPEGIRVLAPDGQEVPAQLEPGSDGSAKVVFLASAPSVGYAVYDVQPASAPPSASTLQVSNSSLENARYKIQIDDNGDVSSIFDKQVNHELLSAPLRLAISTDNPEHWPAWNMDFEDEQRPPRAYVGGPAHVEIVEHGPARVALEISREGENSKFVQRIRLSAGDAGNRVEVMNAIDWATKGVNLKQTFPLSASNPNATYNWDIGTVERPNEFDRQFEVATHRWIDLTDQSGSYGVTVLTDAKTGSDKPSDNTLRLTLIRTPGTRGGYEDQGTQDWGRHEFEFGLTGHRGDWRQAQTDWQAYRLNEPLIAFQPSAHVGALGRKFSLLQVSNNRVRVLAMKKAEESDAVIVRLVEMSGHEQPDVHLTFAGPVADAREVNGQEQPTGSAKITNGDLVASFSAYQPRSFAVKLAPPHAKAEAVESKAVALSYDASVATLDGKPGEGCFDCDLNRQTAEQGNALPAEMLPSQITYGGVQFRLAPAGLGKPDALTAHGQSIKLPAGDFNHLYLLAAAYGGDQEGTLEVASPSTSSRVGLKVEDWSGFIGQWDTRTWPEKKVEVQVPPEPAADDQSRRAERARRIRAYVKEHGPIIRTEMEYTGLKPAYIKRAPVAWFASHRHSPGAANEAYSYSYLFAYEINLPAGATTLTLPDNGKIRILAATVAKQPHTVKSIHALYDTLDRANFDLARWNR